MADLAASPQLARRLDVAGWAAALLARDRLVVAFLIGLAALLRLPGLENRGIFDADQGRDMLVIYNLVEHGQFPLLGPETISIANSHLHHGAFYWYLFAPAAWLSGGNTFAVVIEMALIGIAAVVATWWAGRLMGGPIVGAVAGLLMAVSPAAVEQSIFLWNPNPIPLFAALALGGAWQGHRTGRARWYALAIGSAFAVFQLHLLGAAFVIPILGLVLYDLVSAIRKDRTRLRGIGIGILIGAAITAVLFVPLLVNELQTNFEETRRTVQFLLHGGSVPTVGGLDPVSALLFITFRIIGWPFVGLVIDAPLAAVVAVGIFFGLVIWWLVVARGEDRLLIGWLAGMVVFSVFALSVMAPWLRFVVIGFPTDHYHAFLNPVIAIALPLAGLGFVRGRQAKPEATRPRDEPPPPDATRPPARVGAAVILSLLLVAELAVAAARQPGTSEVATWPGADAIAAQVLELTGDRPIALVPVPEFKSPDSIGYPIVYLGGTVVEAVSAAQVLVVNCDERFRETTLLACAGPAEDREVTTVLSGSGRSASVLARITESSAMTVSVYQVSP
jgi:hypothetical protein